MDWIYGYKPVLETLQLDATRVKQLVVSRRRQKGLEALQKYGVPIRVVDSRELDERFGEANHQGIAAECTPFAYQGLNDWLDSAPDDAVAVILDGVQDAGNLGAIIRTAVATGAHVAILPERKAASVTPAAIRASAGLASRLPVVRVTNVARAMGTLRDAGFWITGAATRGGKRPWEVDLTGRVAIVVGSEAKGMRRLVAENCDHLVTVPLEDGVESLNVAAAAAMLLYEIRRQRSDGR
jgi:23S rRNA (guanosine2251-2'-O)-methyltransferase